MTAEPEDLDDLPSWRSVIFVVLVHVAVIAAALVIAFEIKPGPHVAPAPIEQRR